MDRDEALEILVQYAMSYGQELFGVAAQEVERQVQEAAEVLRTTAEGQNS